MGRKILLGVVGNNGSGKSTFCNYLASKNFLVVSLSDVIRDSLKAKSLEPNRENLTEHANELKKKYGLTYCAQKTYDLVTKSNTKFAVFDSIRHPAEVKYLQEKKVKLVAIKTSIENRYNRIKQRKRQTDFINYETFRNHDDKLTLNATDLGEPPPQNTSSPCTANSMARNALCAMGP